MSTVRNEPVFAAIDAGSHTIRLLVASLAGNREITPLRVERRITRLAAGFQEGETLKEPGMSASIAVFRDYAALLHDYRVRSVTCGATGVIRRARNGEEFLREVHDATGIRPSILSEEAEALLSTKGVLSVLGSREGTVLTFDLGGGSTEFVLVNAAGDVPLWNTSVFIGAATITERRLSADPPGAGDLAQASAEVKEAIAPALAVIRKTLKETPTPGPFRIVGTAGTATTLAAMNLEMTEYVPFRVNGSVLSDGWLLGIINRLSRSTLDERRGIPGLEKGREDIILGGALIVHEILEGLGRKDLTVTDGGLLEGLLLESIESETSLPRSLHTPLTWRLPGV